MRSTEAVDSLKRNLNGDRETMDGAVRRGLFSNAAEIDALRDDTKALVESFDRSMNRNLEDIEQTITFRMNVFEQSVDRHRKAMYGVGATILASAIAVIVSVPSL